LLFAAQEGPTGDITVATQEAESFTVRRLSADLGLVRASSALPRSTYSAVFPVDGAVLAFTNDGVSRLLDPSGRTVWVSGERLPAAGRVIAGQRYIAVTGADEHLVLRASDGSVAMRLKRSIFGRVFGFSGESAILACRPDEICVVDVRESRMRWRFRTGGAVNGVTVTGGTLIAASSDNFIYRLAAGDGDVIWKARTGDRVLAAPVVSGELVFAVNSLQGTVGIYDLADGRPRDLARIPSGETIVAVLPLRDGRFVVSTAGRIYEFGYECAEKRTADPEGFAVPGFKGTSLPVSATSSIPGSYRTSRP
jgi:outer membrane protein assembly factor BamB